MSKSKKQGNYSAYFKSYALGRKILFLIYIYSKVVSSNWFWVTKEKTLTTKGTKNTKKKFLRFKKFNSLERVI